MSERNHQSGRSAAPPSGGVKPPADSTSSSRSASGATSATSAAAGAAPPKKRMVNARLMQRVGRSFLERRRLSRGQHLNYNLPSSSPTRDTMASPPPIALSSSRKGEQQQQQQQRTSSRPVDVAVVAEASINLQQAASLSLKSQGSMRQQQPQKRKVNARLMQRAGRAYLARRRLMSEPETQQRNFNRPTSVTPTGPSNNGMDHPDVVLFSPPPTRGSPTANGGGRSSPGLLSFLTLPAASQSRLDHTMMSGVTITEFDSSNDIKVTRTTTANMDGGEGVGGGEHDEAKTGVYQIVVDEATARAKCIHGEVELRVSIQMQCTAAHKQIMWRVHQKEIDDVVISVERMERGLIQKEEDAPWWWWCVIQDNENDSSSNSAAIANSHLDFSLFTDSTTSTSTNGPQQRSRHCTVRDVFDRFVARQQRIAAMIVELHTVDEVVDRKQLISQEESGRAFLLGVADRSAVDATHQERLRIEEQLRSTVLMSSPVWDHQRGGGGASTTVDSSGMGSDSLPLSPISPLHSPDSHHRHGEVIRRAPSPITQRLDAVWLPVANSPHATSTRGSPHHSHAVFDVDVQNDDVDDEGNEMMTAIAARSPSIDDGETAVVVAEDEREAGGGAGARGVEFSSISRYGVSFSDVELLSQDELDLIVGRWQELFADAQKQQRARSTVRPESFYEAVGGLQALHDVVASHGCCVPPPQSKEANGTYTPSTAFSDWLIAVAEEEMFFSAGRLSRSTTGRTTTINNDVIHSEDILVDSRSQRALEIVQQRESAWRALLQSARDCVSIIARNKQNDQSSSASVASWIPLSSNGTSCVIQYLPQHGCILHTWTSREAAKAYLRCLRAVQVSCREVLHLSSAQFVVPVAVKVVSGDMLTSTVTFMQMDSTSSSPGANAPRSTSSSMIDSIQRILNTTLASSSLTHQQQSSQALLASLKVISFEDASGKCLLLPTTRLVTRCLGSVEFHPALSHHFPCAFMYDDHDEDEPSQDDGPAADAGGDMVDVSRGGGRKEQQQLQRIHDAVERCAANVVAIVARTGTITPHGLTHIAHRHGVPIRHLWKVAQSSTLRDAPTLTIKTVESVLGAAITTLVSRALKQMILSPYSSKMTDSLSFQLAGGARTNFLASDADANNNNDAQISAPTILFVTRVLRTFARSTTMLQTHIATILSLHFGTPFATVNVKLVSVHAVLREVCRSFGLVCVTAPPAAVAISASPAENAIAVDGGGAAPLSPSSDATRKLYHDRYRICKSSAPMLLASTAPRRLAFAQFQKTLGREKKLLTVRLADRSDEFRLIADSLLVLQQKYSNTTTTAAASEAQLSLPLAHHFKDDLQLCAAGKALFTDPEATWQSQSFQAILAGAPPFLAALLQHKIPAPSIPVGISQFLSTATTTPQFVAAIRDDVTARLTCILSATEWLRAELWHVLLMYHSMHRPQLQQQQSPQHSGGGGGGGGFVRWLSPQWELYRWVLDIMDHHHIHESTSSSTAVSNEREEEGMVSLVIVLLQVFQYRALLAAEIMEYPFFASSSTSHHGSPRHLNSIAFGVDGQREASSFLLDLSQREVTVFTKLVRLCTKQQSAASSLSNPNLRLRCATMCARAMALPTLHWLMWTDQSSAVCQAHLNLAEGTAFMLSTAVASMPLDDIDDDDVGKKRDHRLDEQREDIKQLLGQMLPGMLFIVAKSSLTAVVSASSPVQGSPNQSLTSSGPSELQTAQEKRLTVLVLQLQEVLRGGGGGGGHRAVTSPIVSTMAPFGFSVTPQLSLFLPSRRGVGGGGGGGGNSDDDRSKLLHNFLMFTLFHCPAPLSSLAIYVDCVDAFASDAVVPFPTTYLPLQDARVLCGHWSWVPTAFHSSALVIASSSSSSSLLTTTSPNTLRMIEKAQLELWRQVELRSQLHLSMSENVLKGLRRKSDEEINNITLREQASRSKETQAKNEELAAAIALLEAEWGEGRDVLLRECQTQLASHYSTCRDTAEFLFDEYNKFARIVKRHLDNEDYTRSSLIITQVELWEKQVSDFYDILRFLDEHSAQRDYLQDEEDDKWCGIMSASAEELQWLSPARVHHHDENNGGSDGVHQVPPFTGNWDDARQNTPQDALSNPRTHRSERSTPMQSGRRDGGGLGSRQSSRQRPRIPPSMNSSINNLPPRPPTPITGIRSSAAVDSDDFFNGHWQRIMADDTDNTAGTDNTGFTGPRRRKQHNEEDDEDVLPLPPPKNRRRRKPKTIDGGSNNGEGEEDSNEEEDEEDDDYLDNINGTSPAGGGVVGHYSYSPLSDRGSSQKNYHSSSRYHSPVAAAAVRGGPLGLPPRPSSGQQQHQVVGTKNAVAAGDMALDARPKTWASPTDNRNIIPSDYYTEDYAEKLRIRSQEWQRMNWRTLGTQTGATPPPTPPTTAERMSLLNLPTFEKLGEGGDDTAATDLKPAIISPLDILYRSAQQLRCMGSALVVLFFMDIEQSSVVASAPPAFRVPSGLRRGTPTASTSSRETSASSRVGSASRLGSAGRIKGSASRNRTVMTPKTAERRKTSAITRELSSMRSKMNALHVACADFEVSACVTDETRLRKLHDSQQGDAWRRLMEQEDSDRLVIVEQLRERPKNNNNGYPISDPRASMHVDDDDADDELRSLRVAANAYMRGGARQLRPPIPGPGLLDTIALRAKRKLGGEGGSGIAQNRNTGHINTASLALKLLQEELLALDPNALKVQSASLRDGFMLPPIDRSAINTASAATGSSTTTAAGSPRDEGVIVPGAGAGAAPSYQQLHQRQSSAGVRVRPNSPGLPFAQKSHLTGRTLPPLVAAVLPSRDVSKSLTTLSSKPLKTPLGPVLPEAAHSAIETAWMKQKLEGEIARAMYSDLEPSATARLKMHAQFGRPGSANPTTTSVELLPLSLERAATRSSHLVVIQSNLAALRSRDVRCRKAMEKVLLWMKRMMRRIWLRRRCLATQKLSRKNGLLVLRRKFHLWEMHRRDHSAYRDMAQQLLLAQVSHRIDVMHEVHRRATKAAHDLRRRYMWKLFTHARLCWKRRHNESLALQCDRHLKTRYLELWLQRWMVVAAGRSSSCRSLTAAHTLMRLREIRRAGEQALQLKTLRHFQMLYIRRARRQEAVCRLQQLVAEKRLEHVQREVDRVWCIAMIRSGWARKYLKPIFQHLQQRVLDRNPELAVKKWRHAPLSTRTRPTNSEVEKNN